MQKIIISLLVISNIALAQSNSSIDNFSRLSTSEQDKIIQKDFKVLDELISQLTSITKNIDETIKEISKLRGKNREKLCNKAESLNGDIVELERRLSLISHKNSNQYKMVHKEYLNTKVFYNSIRCKDKK